MKVFASVMVPALFLASLAANAQEAPAADAGSLKGKYGVVIHEDCVFSPSGFGPGPLFQPLGATSRGGGTLQGTATLRSDGTGEMALDGAFLGTSASLTPALGYALTCPLQYTITAGGDFAAKYSCTGVTTIGTGSQIGLEISHDGMQVRGHARGKRFVLAASTAFAIETAAGTLAPPAPRMCHRTFQLLKTPAGE